MAKKKNKARKEKQVSRDEKAKPAVVYLLGDSSMVAEYAVLCGAHGYAVVFDWNDPPESPPTFESRFIKNSTHIPPDTAFALELTNLDLGRKRKNLETLDRALPPTTGIASSSVTVSATEQSSWVIHKSRLVGCGVLPTLSQKPLIEIAPTVFSPMETVQVVQRFFESIGKEIELVQDRIGMVFPRIFCQMMNEAAFALQDEIASPQDIDTAMKLGAEYPLGPIEWADKIGLQHVFAVLSALHTDLAEDRYRVAPLLKQMAVGGTWWQRTKGTSEERHSL
jgi:3-hydroxybutyryl-CoA dehydrogenase